MVAFSNTAGGKLIVGVNDNREIVGVEGTRIFEIQDKIASIVSDNCHPQILPEIYTVNIDGKLVLVVDVVRGNLKPYFLKSHGKADGTYVRLGATNRIAGFETIEELERQKRYISYDEEICYDIEFAKFDISPLLERFERMGKPLNNEKLANLKLTKTEHRKLFPTNGLMIILGLFPHCLVKCARFKGITMSVFTDKKEYGGDIFSMLENTQSFVLNHINLKGEIRGLQRTDTYELPVPAIRETTTNAIIHRDYTNRGRDIKVGVYNDVVNVVSLGGLPSSISIEDVFNGRSEARNRVVASIFKELDLIEQWGSGVNRIIDKCMDYGLSSPKITEKNDFFDVELIRTKYKRRAVGYRRKTVGKRIVRGRLRTIAERKARYPPIPNKQ